MIPLLFFSPHHNATVLTCVLKLFDVPLSHSGSTNAPFPTAATSVTFSSSLQNKNPLIDIISDSHGRPECLMRHHPDNLEADWANLQLTNFILAIPFTETHFQFVWQRELQTASRLLIFCLFSQSPDSNCSATTASISMKSFIFILCFFKIADIIVSSLFLLEHFRLLFRLSYNPFLQSLQISLQPWQILAILPNGHFLAISNVYLNVFWNRP